MKNIFIIIAVFAMIFGSCANSSNKKTDTHTHDDGAVHTNHSNATESTPNQEVFEVSKDSIQIKKDSLTTDSLKTKIKAEQSHSHEDGKEHKH